MGGLLLLMLLLGAKVLTPEGKTTVVTGYYPQGQKNIYKVVFGDGRSALTMLQNICGSI